MKIREPDAELLHAATEADLQGSGMSERHRLGAGEFDAARLGEVA